MTDTKSSKHSDIYNNELCDFQRDTVDRVIKQFRKRSRMLVSDEVGLGKTRVAKGVIAEMALIKKNDNIDTLKVVYICSNESIANQNLKILKNIEELNVIDLSKGVSPKVDKRLSTFHYLLNLEELELKNNKHKSDKVNVSINYLTPATSFNYNTKSQGTMSERALMYAHLRNIEELSSYIVGTDEYGSDSILGKLLMGNAKSSFKNEVDSICKEIDVSNKKDKDQKQYEHYNREVKKLLSKSLKQNVKKDNLKISRLTNDIKLKNYIDDTFKGKTFLDFIKAVCDGKFNEYKTQVCTLLIKKLKIVFSNISLEKCQPDLIIMDEFQRYEKLFEKNNEYNEKVIHEQEETSNDEEIDEMDIIIDRFFSGEQNENEPKILLLSATPYRLYSTTSEILKYGEKESHYAGFNTVMKYLYDIKKNEKEWKKFEKIWSDYQKILESHPTKIDEEIINNKKEYENMIYEVICRTERKDKSDLIKEYKNNFFENENLKKALKGDIESYNTFRNLLNNIDSDFNLPIDYIKSSPYLLSFMYDYFKIKKEIKEKIKKRFSKEEKKNLFVDKEKIDNCKEIDTNNYRFEYLKELIFQDNKKDRDNIEKLLWIPPTVPYYKFGGVYEGLEKHDVTKVIIFSHWKFIPRMISTLISYEAERRTIELEENGKLKYINKKRDKYRYFKYSIENNNSILLYPSNFLKDCCEYQNIFNENNGNITIEKFRKKVKKKIEDKLKEEDKLYLLKKGFNDNIMLLLLDDEKYVKDWLKQCINYHKKNVKSYDDINNLDDDETKIFFGKLEKEYDNYKNLSKDNNEIKEDNYDDKIDLLVDLAIASPAICVSRTYDIYNSDYNKSYPTIIAKSVLAKFDTRVTRGIIRRNMVDDDTFWRSVLKYCIDGNFQSMMDEYIHLFGSKDIENIHSTLVSSLDINNISKTVDSYKSFFDDTDTSNTNKISIRTHFALTFSDDDEKGAQRNNSVRDAFNSPFRPFVFATTSLGQEGLDFHNYCRRIVHYNLPSNPIDLEQREGRVYRYKCLAIRQNMKDMFKNNNYNKNIWEETFNKLREDNKFNAKYINGNSPDFETYWCSKNNRVSIERIVPSYPLSNDLNLYDDLKNMLSNYRITIGQLKQQDLSEYYQNIENKENLYINLSPYDKKIGKSEKAN